MSSANGQGGESDARITAQRRPSGWPYQTRSVAVARHGMVATSQPWAVQVGLDVLRQGGNAADAAVAAGAMMGLVEPMSCGIGGDLFVLYWDAKTERLYGLNASGRSPRELSLDEFRRRGLTRIPETGPLSWSVPGCVAGWHDLLERFGTRSLAQLLKPSIEAAEEGFPVTEIIAGYWRSGERNFGPWPDSAATYLPEGRAPRAGELFRNPRLAATYRLLASEGESAFYRGEMARRIVEFSQAHGGYFSLADFAEHRNEWIDPISTEYRGYHVWELPPNGQGLAALQMLNLLEAYDLRRWGPESPDYWHLLIEAKKLAYADRARYYADMAFAKVPVAQLASKAYADQRRPLIDLRRAGTEVPPGDARLNTGDTIYLTVVDSQRNCCSYIQSNYYGFGSQVVPGTLGFVLQNRGALFSLDEHHANVYAPGKRPFHTIIPAMVTHPDGRPWLCFGVMGGDMQPQGHVQILVNMIDFGFNVQAAGDLARVRHSGSATPTGLPAEPGGGTVACESGIPAAVREELTRRGHRIAIETGGGMGGYQAILIDWDQGTLHGASESRKDGCALGY